MCVLDRVPLHRLLCTHAGTIDRLLLLYNSRVVDAKPRSKQNIVKAPQTRQHICMRSHTWTARLWCAVHGVSIPLQLSVFEKGAQKGTNTSQYSFIRAETIELWVVQTTGRYHIRTHAHTQTPHSITFEQLNHDVVS